MMNVCVCVCTGYRMMMYVCVCVCTGYMSNRYVFMYVCMYHTYVCMHVLCMYIYIAS